MPGKASRINLSSPGDGVSIALLLPRPINLSRQGGSVGSVRPPVTSIYPAKKRRACPGKPASLVTYIISASNIHHSLYPLTFEYDYIVLSGKLI